MKWEKILLGDVCKMQTGKTPPTSNSEYFGGDINWMGPGDIGEQKYLKASKRKITRKSIEDKKAILFEPNTLMITCIGEIGRVGISTNYISCNQQITGLLFDGSVKPEYAYYWFIANRNLLADRANNAVVPIINNQMLKNIVFDIPPLHIQEQIANTLDKADALRKRDQELLTKYDELAQAIFYDMFGDPVKNEKGWETVTISEVLEDIQAGTSVGGEDKALEKHEYGVLKISSVTSGKFIDTEYKVPEQKDLPVKMVFPQKGDLLFSRANTRELVGATAVVEKDYKNIFLPDKLWKLKPKKGVSAYYLKYILSDKQIRSNLTKTATGTSGSMLNISMQKLKSLFIPLPDSDMQIKFENSIRSLNRSISNQLKCEEHSARLNQIIMDSYFS